MPTGQHRKPSSSERFARLNKNFTYTSLDAGLQRTVDWFIDAYPNIRGYDADY